MSTNQRENERTLGQLVASATQDMSSIMRSEIELAKTEVTTGLKTIGKGAVMLIAAAVLAVFGLIYLLHAAAHGINRAGLQLWAAYLIVGGVIVLIAAVIGMVGAKALSKAKPAPERAIAQAKQTVEAIKPGKTSNTVIPPLDPTIPNA